MLESLDNLSVLLNDLVNPEIDGILTLLSVHLNLLKELLLHFLCRLIDLPCCFFEKPLAVLRLALQFLLNVCGNEEIAVGLAEFDLP